MAERGKQDRAAWEGEMFRLLAENVKDYAIFVVDPHRHVLSWSKGAERLLGFSEMEIVGQKCDCFFTPEDVERGVPQRELEEALATGRGEDDRWHMRKDGSRFWASGAVTPLKDEAGRLRGFAKIMRDRTELKLAEDAARERERQLQLLTDHAPVLIAHCDADRRYKFVNKPYAARFGLHPRDVVGRPIRDVLGGPAYASIERYVDAALNGERVEFEVEVPYDGQGPQVMRCAYDPEFDEEGRVRGFIAAIVNVTASRRAEAALADSRRRLRAIFHTSLDAILLADDQARFVDANPAACKLLGYSREELLRRTVFDITPPPQAQPGPALWREFMEQGEQAGEYSILRKDGTPVVVEYRAVANILPGLHLSVLRDVGERRRAEDALRASERRFRTLATNAPVGIFQTDPDGNCVFVNDRWCRITGLTPEEAAGAGWVRALHPEDLSRVREEWYAAAAAGLEFAAEYRFRTPRGRTVWVQGKAVALRDEAGEIAGHLGTVIDTTEQQRATEALREGEERLRTLSDNLPNGAVYQVLGDREGQRRFLYVSAGVERLFGLTPAEAMADANCLYGLVHEEDRPRVGAGEEAAARDLTPFDCEFRSWTRSGKLIWVHCRSAPRRLPTGETVWEGIVTDVTARRRAEEELREADRRKDEFLATLAHELRNPLAPLRNGLQLLRVAGDDRATAELARGMMERQLAQLVRLIDDLLDVSRITRGRLELRRESVALATALQSAVETARPLIEASGHDLTVTLPPEPVYLEADATRLAQVFGNLLTNAAKYTERGGHIWLTAGRRGREVVVTVRDTGIGIAAEHLPHLFEMFSQVTPALERSQGGLGIGLSLVKGLVEMHGGTVEARSDGPGKGSEFAIRLPASDGPVVRGPPQSAGVEESRERPRRRILVVDDNRDAADSLAMTLRLAGHELHTAYDGPEAVEAAAQFRPDIVLLDIGLPRLNGYEVAHRIREQPRGKEVSLVAVTGWGQEEDKRRAREAGFDHHLTKPVAPADLQPLLDVTPRTPGHG
jgi:PAS domain S-box-containing protein